MQDFIMGQGITTTTGTIYEIERRCLIIKVQDELDHHVAVDIRKTSDKLIRKHNILHIIFDFSNSNFMDSAGIGVIMGRYRQVIFIEGKIGVANVNKSIDRILSFSGLYKIVDKFATVEEGIRRFANI